MLSPAIVASLNSSASTQAKQSSLQVLGEFAFLALSIAC